MENKLQENKTQKTNFTQVPNEILNSDKLSWGAKGLWAYIAGKPEGWKFTIHLMARQSKDGVDATTSRVNELLKAGYLKREIVMTKNGKQCFYSIYEKPNLEKPNLEKPNLEKPNLEKPILEYSNTNISNKEKSNKEISLEKGDCCKKYLPKNVKNTANEEKTTGEDSSNWKMSNECPREIELEKEINKAEQELFPFQDIFEQFFDMKEDEEIIKSVLAWMDMRKKRKWILSERALRRNLNKAFQLADGDKRKVAELFDLAEDKNWKGVFKSDELGWEKEESSAGREKGKSCREEASLNNETLDFLHSSQYN